MGLGKLDIREMEAVFPLVKLNFIKQMLIQYL